MNGVGTYPDPNDPDPATRDAVNLGESPVGKASNDGGHELGKAEGNHESGRWALHEEESMRTGDEDKSLRDDGDLKIHNHVQLRIVMVLVAIVTT